MHDMQASGEGIGSGLNGQREICSTWLHTCIYRALGVSWQRVDGGATVRMAALGALLAGIREVGVLGWCLLAPSRTMCGCPPWVRAERLPTELCGGLFRAPRDGKDVGTPVVLTVCGEHGMGGEHRQGPARVCGPPRV